MNVKNMMMTITSLVIVSVFWLTACSKQESRNPQTPDSEPTSTSPMNPK